MQPPGFRRRTRCARTAKAGDAEEEEEEEDASSSLLLLLLHAARQARRWCTRSKLPSQASGQGCVISCVCSSMWAGSEDAGGKYLVVMSAPM